MDVDSESSSVYSNEYFIGENTNVDICRDLKPLESGPLFQPKYTFTASYDYLCDAEVLKTGSTTSIFLGSTDNELAKYIYGTEVCLNSKRTTQDTVSSIKLNSDKSKLLVSDLAGNIFVCHPDNIETDFFTWSTNSCQWTDWFNNSSQIICGMSDGSVEVISVESGQYIAFGDVTADFDYNTPLVKLWNDTAVAYGCINGSIIVHDVVNNCRSHKFSCDDQRPVLLLISSQNESLLYAVHEGSKEIVIMNLHNKIISLDYEFRGLWLVSVGNKYYNDVVSRCKIGIWDITSHRLLDHFDFDGTVLFAELIDKNRVLISLEGGLIHIVDITNKAVLCTTNIGDSEQHLVKYFKNEKVLITSSGDKIVNVFEVK